MTESDWKTVPSRGKRRRSKRRKGASSAACHVNAPLAPDHSTPNINKHHVNNLAESLRNTDWWKQTAAHILEATSTHAGCRVTLYCLGMGSFAPWNNGSHQLACACLLRELLQVDKCFVGDPCMNEADELVLRQLHMDRREWQPGAQFEVQNDTLLFMFLPHCALGVNDGVLRTLHRCGALDRVVFLANQFSLYWDSLAVPSAGQGELLKDLYENGRLEEKACPCSKTASSETAFNDLCVTRVVDSRESLQKQNGTVELV